MYRIFRAARSPWWFSSDGSGRFDLPFPDGTCYLAQDPLGALLEVARGLTILSDRFLDSRRLLIARPTRELRLADLNAAGAYAFGVTGELSGTADYAGPQAWAAALRTHGFDGVRYRIRHDPRGDLVGVGWFGRAGRWGRPPAGLRVPVPTSVLLDAAPFGIRIAPAL